MEMGTMSEIVSLLTLKPAVDVVKDALVPEIPTPPPPPGLSQANVQEAAPDVDLAQTEAQRRSSGQAAGTRKLRIPLGGL